MKTQDDGARESVGEASLEEVVTAYHERTKHHLHRFAASLGYLDWETQPDPFRRYPGTEVIRLSLPPEGRPLPYRQLYSPGAVSAEALSIDSISLFFRYSLSLTAWKQLRGARWALRANPSSGNLHPTEGYAILPALEMLGDAPAVYHYAPREHALERRAVLEPKLWDEIASSFPPGSFLVGVSSIVWREAWKYGERAFRYCQHDVGHALAALRIAAAALGWRAVLLEDIPDPEISHLLGLDRNEDFGEAEREEPDFLALIAPQGTSVFPRRAGFLPILAGSLQWAGKANPLSPAHGVEWSAIDEVARATSHSTTGRIPEDFSRFPAAADLAPPPILPGVPTAEKIILSRRSAVAMDGSTAISKEAFFRMLGRLIPTRDGRSIPWDAIPWRPRIHLGLFVHRVDDLATGLYALVRDPDKLQPLQSMMNQDFLWLHVPDSPLPLYLLRPGDYRTQSIELSCGQAIAGEGAFSLGMLADYLDALKSSGAAFYRNLFWEAGMIGQVLYLEAEEAGVRATGIGCYFDDLVHEVFGIASREWQSFYHFTVGRPVEDARLTTLPAYSNDR